MPIVRISLAWIAICFSWHTLADFPTAKSLFEKQEYQLAKPRLEKLAELGHLEAQFLVSRIYAEGLGTEVDINKAYAWSLIARDRDHPEAAQQYLALRRKLDSRRDGKDTFSNLNSKYGKDAFVFKILEHCEPDKLFEREEHWINKFLDNCYNVVGVEK